MLTGEPLPVQKKPGDRVIGATINTKGALIMRAERVGSETVLSQIVEMVAQAQRSRAPMQRMADAVAYWFLLAVVGVAIVTFLAWGILGPQPSGLWLHQRDCRPHHRLSLCAGLGDAYVHHGGNGPCCDVGSPISRC
jgi:cation transport ATPase